MENNVNNSIKMPLYQCHKKVWALKIADIQETSTPEQESDGSKLLVPEDTRYAPFKVDREYVQKHKPQIGGYHVCYQDGYQSFSPAKAFEDGYTLID